MTETQPANFYDLNIGAPRGSNVAGHCHGYRKLRPTLGIIMENEPMDHLSPLEPPSYTYQQLEELLHRVARKLMEKENSEYLTRRSVAQCQQYLEKYSNARDDHTSYNTQFNGEMAKPTGNPKDLVISALKSNGRSDKTNKVIAFLQKSNPNFEMRAIDGDHYINLNNLLEVADALKPFTSRRRPCCLCICRRRRKSKL